jgi:hypothetical protein
MIPFSSEQADIAFAAFVREWFRLLSRGEFAQAAAALDEPNSYGQLFTAESIRQSLLDYTRGQEVSVTDPDRLPPDPHQSARALTDGSGYSYYCTVPLDGAWSDLTAQFEFLRRADGYAAILHDLHVL